MAISPDQISKVLQEIGSRVPKNLLKNAFKEEKLTPTVEFVLQESLKSQTISEEKKKQIKTVLDSGDVSQKKIVENPKYTKMIDSFYAREINKAVKEGRLPPKGSIKDLPDIKHFKKLYEEAHNRQNKTAHTDERGDTGAKLDSTEGSRAGI